MGGGRPPSPALSAVSAMCCCSWRALPSFSSSGVSSKESRVPNHRLGTLPFVLSYRTRKDRNMPDKSITKVSSEHAPKGSFGQKYLASGIHISMRLWEREQPAEAKPQTARDYETVGLVLEGKAELHIEGQLGLLEKGDSWVVPKGSRHTYNVIETFTAVEATSPPAEGHGRAEYPSPCWNPLMKLMLKTFNHLFKRNPPPFLTLHSF